MEIPVNPKVDPLAEATGGKHHWNDPGMADLEEGWEDFPLGTRVEVRINDIWEPKGVWLKGTVVQTPHENDRSIVVKCDKRFHDNMNFYGGRGATVMVYMNTCRGILSRIRKIGEPSRKVVIPRPKPTKLEGKTADFLRIAKLAVRHSGGRLRLAFAEKDESEEFDRGAQRFLKLDGKRLGRDIELYCFMIEVAGKEEVLLMFLEEIILPIKSILPKSSTKAGKALYELGKSVYPEHLLQKWRDLFSTLGLMGR